MPSKPFVLIADDEKVPGELHAGCLQPDDAPVLVHNGTEDLEKALSLPGLSGLLADVRMPGISGLQVVREVPARRSGVGVMVMSGTDINAHARHRLNFPHVSFPVKPT